MSKNLQRVITAGRLAATSQPPKSVQPGYRNIYRSFSSQPSIQPTQQQDTTHIRNIVTALTYHQYTPTAISTSKSLHSLNWREESSICHVELGGGSYLTSTPEDKFSLFLSDIDTRVSDTPGAVAVHHSNQSERQRADAPLASVADWTSRKVMVENLASSTAWQNLKDHMRAAGTVDYVKVYVDSEGNSTSAGEAEFSTIEEARAAVEALNGTELDGQIIRVSPMRDSLGIVEDRQDRRVFVGNMSTDTTWHELKDHLSVAGDLVYIKLFTTPMGQSKGCAVAEFNSSDQARNALDRLNGSLLHEKNIRILPDRDNKERMSASQQRRANPDRFVKSEKRVFVFNVPRLMDRDGLIRHMSTAGNVTYAKIYVDESGQPKGCGIVEFSSVCEAEAAVRILNNSTLDGRTIGVCPDEGPKGIRRART